MTTPLEITFVLPLTNETEAFAHTAETIFRVAGSHVRELLVVIADRTEPASRHAAEKCREAHPEKVRIHRQTLPRLGGAVREAFQLAAGRHLMLMASDLETDPEWIPRFIDRMRQGDCDVVAGSRWLPGGGFEGYGRMKMVANWLFQRIVRVVYRTPLTDLTFAYRLYRREVLDGIAWHELGHPFLLECLLKPLRLGARVVEIPCPWRARVDGASANSVFQMVPYWRVALGTRLLGRRAIRPAAACLPKRDPVRQNESASRRGGG